MSIKKYIDNNVKYHIDIIENLTKKIKEYKLSPDNKKEHAINIFFVSTIAKHVLRLSEAQVMSEIVLDKKLELPEYIQEQVNMSRKDDIVLVGESTLEMADGTKLDELVSKIKNNYK